MPVCAASEWTGGKELDMRKAATECLPVSGAEAPSLAGGRKPDRALIPSGALLSASVPGARGFLSSVLFCGRS